MMQQQRRPQYEDASSLEAERAAIALVERAWGVGSFKLPIAYQIDYALTHGTTIRAFVEVKCRSCKSDAYRDYMSSVHKVDAAMRLHHVTGLPVFLVVEWLDQIGWLDIGKALRGKAYKVTIGGRIDRDDSADREPVVLFPIADFVRFTAVDSSRQAA